MKKQCISVTGAPVAKGPYNHAVAAGNLLYVSGQGPVTSEGDVVQGTFDEQVRQTLANLKTIVEGSGSNLGQVLKVTVYLVDMNNFAAFNEIYKEFFTAHYPARTCVQVARLPLDFSVEVDAIALLP